jgi:hypothetical protein
VSERPLPRPSALTRPHWDGCREGVLRVQRCRECRAHVFIPQPLCTACGAGGLEWIESRGHGTVYSFSVVHRAPHPAFATPYLVAIVTLDEGFEMLANLACDAALAAIGMRVRVAFLPASETIALPYFVAA